MESGSLYYFHPGACQPLAACDRTCELAGFGGAYDIDRDLPEWDYGQYEGRLTTEIHAERPGWQLFRDGALEVKRRTRWATGRCPLERFRRGIKFGNSK